MTKDNLITIRLNDSELLHLEHRIGEQTIKPSKAAAAHHFLLSGMGYIAPAPAEPKPKAPKKGKQ